MQAIRENVWLRVLILGIALMVLAPLCLWSFGNNADRLMMTKFLWWLSFQVATILGWSAPAIALGAAWGWIKYSKSTWLWTTAVLLTLTAALFVYTLKPPVS
jgi:hypothetical protein